MALQVSDTFAGSGSLGTSEVGAKTWQIVTGTWTRSGGYATTSTADSSNPIAVVDAGSPDVDLTVTGNNADALYFRVVDPNNWWRVIKRVDTYTNTYTEYEFRQFYGHASHPTPNGAASPPNVWLNTWTTNPNGPSFQAVATVVENHTHPYNDGGSVSHSHNYNRVNSWSSTGQTRQATQSSSYDRALLQRCVGGTIVTIATWDFSNNTENIYRIRARGSSISGYVNGELKGTVTDTTHGSAIRHGIGRGGDTGGSDTINTFDLTVIEPPVPVIVSPSPSSVVPSATPTLVATVGSGYDSPVSMQWQLATDSGFTANLRTVTSASATSGNLSVTVPLANKLAKGTWYLRVRAIDGSGVFSPWTSGYQVTVAHPPSGVNLVPTGGNGVSHTGASRFSWDFNDPWSGDTQTAFQIQIERNDTGAAVYDSGKTTSANKYVDYTIAVGLRDVQLRWRLKVWDSEDTESPWTSFNVFVPTLAPVVSITVPASGGTVTTNNPTFSWTFTGGSRVQVSYRVVVTNTSTSAVVYDSGVKPGNSLTNQAPGPILQNGQAYSVTVTSVDNVGVSGSDTHAFITSYVAPPTVAFGADQSMYESDGYVLVGWEAVTDAGFLSWRVYRQVLDADNWEVIATITEPTAREFKDWLVPSQNTYEYLVVQVVERFGETVESAVANPAEVYVGVGGYWFIDPFDYDNSARLHNVTADSYKTNRERAEFNVIGRGRHVDIGENIGKSGSMTGQLRTEDNISASQKLDRLEALIERGVSVYLRNPFGKIWLVSLGDADVSRIAGVGPMEFVDVTIPYSEVF